ncbi:MAG TPA: efflux RND transporter periplasmic adaptor subunit [Puia sp.]|nr:efflux RND transporter periplasmic adaptor subunit [Puia sp.]
MKNKRPPIVLIASALVALSVLNGCSSSDGEGKNGGADSSSKSAAGAGKSDSAAVIQTVVLEKGRLSTTLHVPGELIAFQQVDLYAKVNSFVKRLYVDVGSEVREGDLLATMEAPELQSQLATALARVKSQEAIYIASKSNYDRIIETSKTPGTISQNDIDQADARQKSDDAQLEANKAAYNEIAETLKYLEVRAPFNGVISSRNVNPGAYVGPSGKGSEVPMFTLQEQKHMRLVVSVPEDYTGYLNDNDKVQFSVRALPERKFTAEVHRLAGALDSRLRAERTEMDVYSNDKTLLPGMVAEVDLPLPARDSTFIVPASAVVNGTEEVFVVRVGPDQKAEWVRVRQGRSEGGRIEVYSDSLKEGDVLVKSASEEVRDGSTLHVAGH